MKQMPDRKKLRRDYLRKKYGGIVAEYLGAAIVPAFCCAVVLLSHRLSAPQTVLYLLLGMVASLGVKTAFASRRLRRQMLTIPYVPPVTAATLPADEILVRGSVEPPVVQSEVLLRAAKGQETPKEALLRVGEE